MNLETNQWFAEEAKSLELSPISSVFCDAPNVNQHVEEINYLPNLRLSVQKSSPCN